MSGKLEAIGRLVVMTFTSKPWLMHPRLRSIINAAAAASPIQPLVNLGQGFLYVYSPRLWAKLLLSSCLLCVFNVDVRSSGYNPPQFLRDAVKKTMDDDDCHQYAPPRGHPSMTHALSRSYSPLWDRRLDPDKEVLVTTGANEG